VINMEQEFGYLKASRTAEHAGACEQDGGDGGQGRGEGRGRGG